MSKTKEDLQDAFAGESQANRRYLAFAKKADEEGFEQIARLFRAAAAAETVHAHNHLKALKGVNSTGENVEAAITGENHEVVSMYPAFIQDAEQEEEKAALRSFRWAWEVEKEHEALFQHALDTIEMTPESYDYYVCPYCGHTHPRCAPERCPVCGAPAERFERIS